MTGFKAALQKRVEEVTKKKEEHQKNVSYSVYPSCSVVMVTGGCIQQPSIETEYINRKLSGADTHVNQG